LAKLDWSANRSDSDAEISPTVSSDELLVSSSLGLEHKASNYELGVEGTGVGNNLVGDTGVGVTTAGGRGNSPKSNW